MLLSDAITVTSHQCQRTQWTLVKYSPCMCSHVRHPYNQCYSDKLCGSAYRSQVMQWKPGHSTHVWCRFQLLLGYDLPWMSRAYIWNCVWQLSHVPPVWPHRMFSFACVASANAWKGRKCANVTDSYLNVSEEEHLHPEDSVKSGCGHMRTKQKFRNCRINFLGRGEVFLCSHDMLIAKVWNFDIPPIPKMEQGWPHLNLPG